MVKTIECFLSIDFYFRVYCGIFGKLFAGNGISNRPEFFRYEPLFGEGLQKSAAAVFELQLSCIFSAAAVRDMEQLELERFSGFDSLPCGKNQVGDSSVIAFQRRLCLFAYFADIIADKPFFGIGVVQGRPEDGIFIVFIPFRQHDEIRIEQHGVFHAVPERGCSEFSHVVSGAVIDVARFNKSHQHFVFELFFGKNSVQQGHHDIFVIFGTHLQHIISHGFPVTVDCADLKAVKVSQSTFNAFFQFFQIILADPAGLQITPYRHDVFPMAYSGSAAAEQQENVSMFLNQFLFLLFKLNCILDADAVCCKRNFPVYPENRPAVFHLVQVSAQTFQRLSLFTLIIREQKVSADRIGIHESHGIQKNMIHIGIAEGTECIQFIFMHSFQFLLQTWRGQIQVFSSGITGFPVKFQRTVHPAVKQILIHSIPELGTRQKFRGADLVRAVSNYQIAVPVFPLIFQRMSR